MANQPDMYELHGGGIHVTYSTSTASFSGKPLLTYHDHSLVKDFIGDQIKTLQTDIGTLVTVVIHMTPDRGSTTFSLLIPRVNLPPADVANITAEGITTLQKFSLPLPVGQTQFYTVHTLHGTARFVVG
jgi:hypothetical protein